MRGMVGCALGLALVAGGCTPDPPAPAPLPDAEASIVASAEIGAPFPTLPDDDGDRYHPQDRGVRVEYSVTNAGEHPLLVAAERGHSQGRSGPDRPESAWVSGGSDGSARFSKQVFPQRGNELLTDPFRAPAAVLAPGESVTGRMFVRLPILEAVPTTSLLRIDVAPMPPRPTSVEPCVQVAPARSLDVYPEIVMSQPQAEVICAPVIALDEELLRVIHNAGG